LAIEHQNQFSGESLELDRWLTSREAMPHTGWLKLA
jgi:hypothetical protein